MTTTISDGAFAARLRRRGLYDLALRFAARHEVDLIDLANDSRRGAAPRRAFWSNLSIMQGYSTVEIAALVDRPASVVARAIRLHMAKRGAS